MQQYTITRNGKDDETLGEDAGALCRIYQNCPLLIEQDLPQGHCLYDTSAGAPGNSSHMLDLDFFSRQGKAYTSNRQNLNELQANDAEAAALVARDDPLNRENVPDAEGEYFEGDYLAVSDLGSPSSSSGNSSCVTMSPDERSATRGLRDTENEFIQHLEEQGHDHKVDMASIKRDRILTRTLLLGSSTDHENEEVLNKRARTASYPHASTSSDETAGQTLPQQAPPSPSPNANVSTRKASATERWNKGLTLRKILQFFRTSAPPPSSSTSSSASNLPNRRRSKHKTEEI